MKSFLLFFILSVLLIGCSFAAKPVVGESNDSVCDLCEYFVFELEQMVNKSKPEIEKKLVQICEGLSKEYRSMCDTMVLLYGPKIIDFILAKEDPKTLCTQFHLCPKKIQVPEFVPSNDVKCQLCTYVVQMAEQYVAKNSTIQEIEAELHKVCEKLPSVFGQACNNLVDENIPYIVYYLKQKYPAEKVCEILKLCTPAAAPKPQNDQLECFMCVKFAQMAEDYLASNKTEQEIEAALDKICEHAPFGKKDVCDALVHQYLPYIIHFLESKYPAKKVCEMMNMCPKPTTCDNGLEKCPTCMIIIEAVEKLIGEVITRSEVEHALETVCQKVNPKIQGQCKILVDQFAMPIIEAVVQRATPSTICKLVKQC